jgi:hypothetical protein
MIKRSILAAGLAAALFAAPALADDRPPTPEERARIEGVLATEGFTSWDEIEWDDDGHWEVDDAVGPDGRQYDLKLDASFVIISRDPD